MAKEQRTASISYEFKARPGPTGTKQINSSEAYQTLAHPLRSAVFAHLRLPRSAKELAAELDVPVARLYHHIKLLQKNGLIAVVDERRAGSNAERVYRVAAARIEISGMTDWDESVRKTNPRLAETHRRFTDAIELATEARLKAERTQGDLLLDPWLVEAICELNEEQVHRVLDRFREAVRELQAEMNAGPGKQGRRYGLHLAFTPFPEGKEQRWTQTSHEGSAPT